MGPRATHQLHRAPGPNRECLRQVQHGKRGGKAKRNQPRMAVVRIDFAVLLVHLREACGHVASDIKNPPVLQLCLSRIVGQMVVEASGGRPMESQGIPSCRVFAAAAINSVPKLSSVQSSQRGTDRAQLAQVGSVRQLGHEVTSACPGRSHGPGPAPPPAIPAVSGTIPAGRRYTDRRFPGDTN